MSDKYFAFSVEVAGTTATPSQVKIKGFNADGSPLTGELVVRAVICNDGTYDDSTNATIAPVSGKGHTVATHQATKDLAISTSELGTAATETLTFTGVVIDGETVSIADRVYEFDTDGVTTDDNIAVDISGDATASQGILTIATQPTAGDTMTIGSRTYAFVANGTADHDGEISVGTDLATAKAHILAALAGTDDVNEVHPTVTASAFSTNDSTLTAKVPGTAGDAIVTTETFAAGGNVFDAVTLGTETAGVDCIAADAITALVAAITGDSGAVVTAVDGTGDTIDITATVAGVTANAYELDTDCANATWGDTEMSGGVDALGGEVWVAITNATAETVTLRIGEPDIGGIGADCRITQQITHAAP